MPKRPVALVHVGHHVGRDVREQRKGSTPSGVLSERRLRDPVQVTGGVVHGGQTGPVLPRVGQRISGDLWAELGAIVGDHDPQKVRARRSDEHLELACRLNPRPLGGADHIL